VEFASLTAQSRVRQQGRRLARKVTSRRPADLFGNGSMTEAEFWEQSIYLLEGVRFCVHASAFSLAWLGGALSFKIFLYGVKCRDIW
jgi:hypothetical protein